MKKLFLLYFAVFICTTVQLKAQDLGEVTLQYEAIVDQNQSLFSNNANWSEVTIQCKNTYTLSYKISSEKIVDITSYNISTDAEERAAILEMKKKTTAVYAKRRMDGDENEYVFWFRAGGDNKNVSDKRRLIVSYYSGASFKSFYIDLRDISPKSRYRYRVFNPDDANDGSVFQEHSVKAQKYYYDCNYLAARQEYILASYCDATEEEKAAVQEKIDVCDQIISLTKLGEEYVSKEMWAEAAERFLEASLKKGGGDKYLSTRYSYCISKLRNSSAIQYQTAEMLMEQKNYLAAKELFDKVAAMSSTESSTASERAKLCEEMARKRQNKESLFGFMFGLGELKTIGIINASYKERVGAFWTLGLNVAECTGLGDYNPQEHACIDFVAGPTIHIIKASKIKNGESLFQGLWLDLGIGGTVVNTFRPKGNFRDYMITEKMQLKDLTTESVNAYLANNTNKKEKDILYMGADIAVTPEIGLVVKVWQFGLRFSYRHHIDILNRKLSDKESGAADRNRLNEGRMCATDLLGSGEFTVGAGFCF